MIPRKATEVFICIAVVSAASAFIYWILGCRVVYVISLITCICAMTVPILIEMIAAPIGGGRRISPDKCDFRWLNKGDSESLRGEHRCLLVRDHKKSHLCHCGSKEKVR